MSKKQDYTAMSSAEAEYVALSASFSHKQSQQPHAVLPYQAYPYSVSLHKGTEHSEVILFSITMTEWKSFQVVIIKTTLRIHKDGDGDASFQLKSDSLPHAYAQTTKTFYKHQDSRIIEALELKDKDFRTNSDIQDLPSKISSLSREIVIKLSR
ncbi:hypothetical protein Tco_0109474 [Tanacetum coccineum]